MFADRTTARVVGVLFIVASASAIIGGSLLLPLGEPDFLQSVGAREAQVVSGALIEILLVLSVVAIAAVMYPVLKRRNEGMAIGYLGARTLEGGLLLAASIAALLVLSLSKDFGATGPAGVEPLGASLLAARDWTYLLGSLVVFGLSALLLNTLLLRARLVPGWLAWWGITGGVLLFARGILEMYGTTFSGAAQAVFAAPIGLQEVVLAILLIAKGFQSSNPPSVQQPADRAPSPAGVGA